MKLHDVQGAIRDLCNRDQAGSGSWDARAVKLATALLPVLTWPDPDALRGDENTLLDLDQLIGRANIRTEGFADFAWDGVRSYLGTVPGLSMDAHGQIVVVDDAKSDAVREQHGYITMLLGKRH